MSNPREFVMGVGCDFESGNEESFRKYAIENLSGGEKDRMNWMIKNMHLNKSFIYYSKNKNKIETENLLNEFKKNYLNYRKNWQNQPKFSIQKKLYGDKFKDHKIKPLCLDLEVASVCDLACSFCYRQYVATPDKIMKKELAFKLIDQASKLGIPSMKFNWRGEPLLNPKFPEIVDYAKQKGILETLINTNATKLDEKMSIEIIKSGLDIMIYSFDGGTKKIYEKMRPGRFSKNNFDNIYENISNFSKIRKKLNSSFPRTKIQMILTEETRKEQDEYYKLFKDIVDEVSVKQYTERGGNLSDLNEKFNGKFSKNNNDLIKEFGIEAALMKDSKDNIYISNQRIPCEQPFQRLLTTYDGKVGMCCYDWGATYTVGYLDNLAYENSEKEYKKIKQKADSKSKGFEMMNLQMPKKNNVPEKKIKDLESIWNGDDINKVRKAHINGEVESINICKSCPFKETYNWKKIQ